jgi:hypothetical protein
MMPFDAYLSPNISLTAFAQIEPAARLTTRAVDGRSEWAGVVFVSDPQAAPDDPLAGPPLSPGTEVRLNAPDPTGVVAHCDAVQTMLGKRGLKVVRKIVSQNSQYGVVWRADMKMSGEDGASSRLICWKIPGRAGYSVFSQPLQMFDPSQSIPPLAP